MNMTVTVQDGNKTVMVQPANDPTLDVSVVTRTVSVTSSAGAGPKGDKGDAGTSYVHDQGVAASVWTIVHNLNKYPSVATVDTGFNEVEGVVHYVDLNTLTVTFNATFSGEAFLN